MGADFEALIEGVLLVPLDSRYTQVGYNLFSVQVCDHIFFPTATAEVIPEEDSVHVDPGCMRGTAELMEQEEGGLPPPLVSVDAPPQPHLHSHEDTVYLPLGPMEGNICSTPIAYAESTESLHRKPSFLNRSAF